MIRIAWCKSSDKSPAYMDGGGGEGVEIGETIVQDIDRAWLRNQDNRRVIITR